MFDKNKINELLHNGKKLSEILREFGLKVNGGNYRSLKEFMAKNAITAANNSREEYEKHPKYCAFCGKKIDYVHRANTYCSQSCAASVNNSKFPKRVKQNMGKRNYPDKREYEENELYCIVCGKKLIGNQKKFCSVKCKNKCYSNQKYHTDYSKKKDEDGTLLKYEYILKLGGKCSKCGYDKNLSALSFHHLRDKEFTLTSRAFSRLPKEMIENEIGKCVLLCQNCHHEEHHPSLTKENIENIIKNKK